MSQGKIICNRLEVTEVLQLLIDKTMTEEEGKKFKTKFASNYTQFKKGNGVSMKIFEKMLKEFNYSFELNITEDA